MNSLPFLPAHPVAEWFPRMTADEYDLLVADIHRVGALLHPIVMCEGMILDGRHRYDAIRDLRERNVYIEPVFEEYDGNSPLAHACSLNLHRRHLSDGQKAAIGLTLKDALQAAGQIRPGRPSEKDGVSSIKSDGDRGAAREIAARSAGVSGRSIDRLAAVRKKDPHLFELVRDGAMSIYGAEKELEREQTTDPSTAAVDPDVDAFTAEEEAERAARSLSLADASCAACCPTCGRPL